MRARTPASPRVALILPGGRSRPNGAPTAMHRAARDLAERGGHLTFHGAGEARLDRHRRLGTEPLHDVGDRGEPLLRGQRRLGLVPEDVLDDDGDEAAR